MIFPLLIFVSSLLGLLQLDVDAILGRGAGVPAPGDRVLHRGLPHLCGPEPQCEAATVCLFFSLYFPMRATNTLMRSVRIAYHLGRPGARCPSW